MAANIFSGQNLPPILCLKAKLFTLRPMNSVVEDIKARINIADVVGEYVRLTKSGANLKGLCPFHNEKSPSFMVHEDKQIFHCFGCGKGGDVFTFLMELENLDFREVLKMLAERTGVELSAGEPQEKSDKKKLLEIMELATKFYETQLWKGMGRAKALPYLTGRGLAEDSLRSFRMGYAPPGWDNILKFLVSRGYEVAEIAKTGLLVEKQQASFAAGKSLAANYYDRFRDRIMFPITDPMGAVIGYSARVLPGADEKMGKYINTPESALYHKGNALYGIYQAKGAIKAKGEALLVEGNLDVIAANQAGFAHTVAVSGTALTPSQVDTLKRFAPRVLMLFDMDSAGQAAAERSADLCAEKELDVRLVRLEGAKDAAEAVEKDPAILAEAIRLSLPAMEYFLQKNFAAVDMRSAEGKKKFVHAMLERIKHVHDPAETQHWASKVAHAAGMDERTVLEMLRKNRPTPSSVGGQMGFREAGDASFQERLTVISEHLAGILLVIPAVWEEFARDFAQRAYIHDDKLLSFLAQKGSSCGYNADALALEVEQDNFRQKLLGLRFAAAYSFAPDGTLKTLEAEEARILAGQYLEEYGRELQKQKLGGIIREIRAAEEAGDREKVQALMGEFTKLTQALK